MPDMNLTENEMLELAEKVYQGRDCSINEKGILIRGSYKETPGEPDVWQKHFYFSPSLTGEDWQAVQAVAVLNRLAQGITSLSDTRAHIIICAMRDMAIEPAARALLSQEPK
jgi:hypothetical protein